MYSAEMKNHANSAAAHSTPTTLAVATLRSANMRSGKIGCDTRDSMVRNAINSARAIASCASVCADVQPAWLPFTMAYTASISDAVTVRAPATSSLARAAGGMPAGSNAAHPAYTATPIGRLTRKMQCQLNAL